MITASTFHFLVISVGVPEWKCISAGTWRQNMKIAKEDKKIIQALRLLDEARVLLVNYDGEEDTYTVIRLNASEEEIHEVFPGAMLEEEE
ncbi:MAG: hypothetical protein ACK4WF_03295 [Candidatus Brocadiales bacterium]